MAVDTTFTYAGIDYTLSVGASGLWQIDDQIDIDGVEIHGDVTESGVTGTMAATGLPVLSGLLDQDIDTPQLDVSALTWGVNKAAGIVTSSSGDFTLGEDAGTVANTGGDYSASTQAADGFIVPVGNTDVIDFNDFDAVFGADGFDASAASGATIQMGSGVIVSQGDFLVHASATLTEETATLVMDGGTVGTPLVLAGPGGVENLVVATGAYLSHPGIAVSTSGEIYGNWLVDDVTLNSASCHLHTGSTCSITTVLVIAAGSSVLVEDGASVTGGGYIYLYAGSSIDVNGGVLGVDLRPRNVSASPFSVAAGSRLSSLTFRLSTAFSPTLTFGAGCEIHGDVSDSGSTGDILSVGTVTLAGTADQTWATATDVSGLTVASTKTDGDVTLSSSIAVDASGFRCDNLTVDQTATLSGTGDIRLTNLLTIDTGTTTCNVDVYCCGYVVDLGTTLQGTGTIFFGVCGETINGASTITSVNFAFASWLNIDINIDI